jgi:sugar/nucleoside kinase (ribokinase family)
MTALKLDPDNCLYKAMIGVGGIGSGSFFQLNGNHTLGREESRSGCFIDQKDYCKLHIISHYVQTLFGTKIPVIPIGKVGDDDVGTRLLKEISETGMIMDYMEQSPESQTLFSFCFLYPDGTGGNMTTSDSACSKVDASFVLKAEPEFVRFEKQGIALAAPEVSMEAREKLLILGTDYHFLRVASFTSEEIRNVVQSDLMRHIDLLAINIDEAAAVSEMSSENNETSSIIDKTIRILSQSNPNLYISITHGKEGSWCWDSESLTHFPAFKVQVVSTAGAGDAYLAGLIVGLTAGLSLPEAQQIGALTGGHSVTSPHTINKGTNRRTLYDLAKSSKNSINKNVFKLLEE